MRNSNMVKRNVSERSRCNNVVCPNNSVVFLVIPINSDYAANLCGKSRIAIPVKAGIY